MSNLLKKALKISITPAALMVVAKLLGLYISFRFLGVQLFLENEINGPFSVQVYITDHADTVLANTISDLLMLGTLTVVTTALITKHLLYRKSQDDPRTIVRLAKFNLMKWVTTQDQIFTKIFIWSFFTVAAACVTISNSINDNSNNVVGITAFFIIVFTIWGLIKTFEIETDKIYPTDRPLL